MYDLVSYGVFTYYLIIHTAAKDNPDRAEYRFQVKS